MTTQDQIKRATQQIRKLARRGTNSKLEELVSGIYTAGIEHGMRAMANQLKERINDLSSNDARHEQNQGIPSVEPDVATLPKSQEPLAKMVP